MIRAYLGCVIFRYIEAKRIKVTFDHVWQKPVRESARRKRYIMFHSPLSQIRYFPVRLFDPFEATPKRP